MPVPIVRLEPRIKYVVDHGGIYRRVKLIKHLERFLVVERVDTILLCQCLKELLVLLTELIVVFVQIREPTLSIWVLTKVLAQENKVHCLTSERVIRNREPAPFLIVTNVRFVFQL